MLESYKKIDFYSVSLDQSEVSWYIFHYQQNNQHQMTRWNSYLPLEELEIEKLQMFLKTIEHIENPPF